MDVPTILLGEVHVIMDHKPLVAIFKKKIATLLKRLQCRLISLHQYIIKTLYKARLDLSIGDWLSGQNYEEKKDEEIPRLKIM